MNPGKQSTLFQSWGKKENKVQTNNGRAGVGRVSNRQRNDEPDVISLSDGDDEVEDEMLARALEESLLYAQAAGAITRDQGGDKIPARNVTVPRCEPSTSTSELTAEIADELHFAMDSNLFDGEFEPSQSLSQIEDIPGFDKVAGKLWIYPTNYPVREYQFNIVSKALFRNTLVTLPTGLGKTFIAAVVMYNFYRWYPQGKVVFMAPTKPLVAQQIEACYNIMGIPQEHTAEMTGNMVPAERLKAWNYKRVFFLTPQVLTNDLSRGACPSVDMKCLVIDEAHKALGNHAYCQVVRELVKYTRDFRILALSATPGSDIKAVQQVVANLLVAHIELRMEESIDIQPYVHERKVVKIVVPLGAELTAIKEKYIRVMDVIVKRLTRQRVLYKKQTTSLSKFMILKAREAFRQNPPPQLQRPQYGAIEGDFALAMSLYHGYELLQLHGLKSLYTYLEGLASGDKGYGRTRTELNKSGDFRELMEDLHTKFGNINSSENTTNPFDLSQRQTPKQAFVSGHPKMEKLREVVLNHFQKYDGDGKGSSSTRIMIFSQYRDSVTEITDMLSRHRPLVKVMSFIGQSSAGKTTKGFTQKEQLKVMKKFRDGGYNTLVSTCVGEEGLDIGDVDLIICFDASKSPIRLVQRMGRTGRKREGSIVMLMTEGKEEQIYNQSQYSKKSIHKAILNGAKSLQFYPHSPRMVPESLQPRCHKMHISVQQAFKSAAKGRTELSKQAKAKNIASMLDQSSKKPQKCDGLLTEAELQYWSDHFKLPDSEVAKLPDSEFRYFKKKNQPQILPEDDGEAPGPVLRLSEWMPWQNRQHPTLLMDHSLGTQHLVEMMEFFDLQQSLGEDDDSYGAEMAAYLNYEHVFCPETDSRGNTGIKKFCSVTDKDDDDDDGLFVNKGSKHSRGAAPVRRSEALPLIGSDIAESNSDEELPPFLGPSSHNPVKQCKIIQKDVADRNERIDSEESNATCTLSAVDISKTSKHSKSEKQIRHSSVGKHLKGKKSQLPPKSNCDSAKLSKRKKKRESVGHRTVVEIILDDDDDNDFVKPSEAALELIPEEDLSVPTYHEEPMEQTNHEEPMEQETVETSVADTVSEKETSKSLVERKVALDLEASHLAQLLPDFTDFSKCLNSPGFLHSSCERSDKHIATPDHQTSRLYTCVPPPPSVCDIQAAFSNLGTNGTFPAIDLLELVDEWEKEKVLQKCNPSVSPYEMITAQSPVSSSKKHKVSCAISSVRILQAGSSHKTSDVIAKNLDSTCFQAIDTGSKSLCDKDLTLENDLIPDDGLTSASREQCDASHMDNGMFEDCNVIDVTRCSGKDVSVQARTNSDVINASLQASQPQCDLIASSLPNSEVHSPGAVSKIRYTSQGFSDQVASSSVEKPSVTVDSVIEMSQVFEEPLETAEDYGEWDLGLSDFDENDMETGQGPVAAPGVPKSPEPDPVPFGRYSSSKLTPVARVKPVQVPEEEDFDPCFEDSDLFLSGVKTPQADTKGMALISRSESVGDPSPGKTPQTATKRRALISCSESVGDPSPGKTPGLDESQFTFTQALACLHDSPAPSQAITPKSAIRSVHQPKHVTPGPSIGRSPVQTVTPKSVVRSVNTNTLTTSCQMDNPLPVAAKCEPSTSTSIFLDSDSDSNDRPEFDLGFSWDDVDVVPPSPVHEQSVCHKPSRCSQSIVFGKRKLSMLSESSCPGDDVHINADVTEFDDDTVTPFEESVVFPSSRDICKSSVRKSLIKLDTNTVSPPSIYPRAMSPPPTYTEADLPRSPIFSQPAFLSARVAENKVHQTTDDKESYSDSDDGFCVVKKKGRQIALIDSPALSSKQNDVVDISPVKPFKFKTPTRPRGEKRAKQAGIKSSAKGMSFSSESEESPLLVRRKKTGGCHLTKPALLSEEDEDFADTTVFNKSKRPHEKSGGKQRKKKRSSAACAFIDAEAELSADGASDVSSDEMDASQMDSVLQDFIYDGSQVFQMTQAADRPDETAMYLRSVMSPLVTDRDGVYRRDRPAVMDVYSQAPPEEYSEYLEDSFCVLGDEEEEGTESDHAEISCFYPVERKSKSKVKSKKDIGLKRNKEKGGVRRKRIVCEVDSSSEEEVLVSQTHDLSCVSGTNTSDREAVRKQTKRARILSSSEDDIPVTSHSSQGHRVHSDQAPVCVDEGSEDTSPPMPSLKSRLQSRVSHTDLTLVSKNCGAPETLKQRQTGSGVSCGRKQATSPDVKRTSPGQCAIQTHPTHSGQGLTVSDQQREQRLRRQREKQEEFRRKMAEKNAYVMVENQDKMNISLLSEVETKLCADKNKTFSEDQVASVDGSFTKLQNPNRNSRPFTESNLPLDNCLVTSPRLARSQEKKIAILVDSREITSGQEVVSCLRVNPQFDVAVRQLTGCDYILSNRLAVERKQWSEFSNGSNRPKLQERIQQMCYLFDRPCLVIERDRIKPGEEKSARPQVRTKYVDMTLAWLAKSSVQIFFTETQEETAALLADLCKLEERKGMTVQVSLHLNTYQEQWLRFFTSIPRISYVNALNLCQGFNNLAELCKSSVKAIQSKGQLSESKAKEIRDFLQHHFCLTMVPASAHT